ncbi:MAG: beta-glucosidase [Lachnospiraceae bacterium]|nr:beta-glucosidase [Lachnospiraceae bacterium]
MSFPENFLWGAASSAFQIEGGFDADGKGPSIWDVMGRKAIAHGENGDVTADQYHHMKEDVALMKEIGLKTYRFSISWSRVLPDGTGRVNETGLKYYSDLVDELINAGIRPMVTLYHWDLPMALQKKGGWENREIIEWFAEYTKVVADALSDRVEYWLTINEPQMFFGLGYCVGAHPPFKKYGPEQLIRYSHHVLLAHGEAVRVLREIAKKPPKIGMAPTGDVYLPEEDSAESIEAARAKSFGFDPNMFTMSNAWWADPVFLGDYPKEAYRLYPEAMKYIKKEDLESISRPLDFYGFNAYNGTVSYGTPADGYQEYSYQGSPYTMLGWPVTPEVLYWSPKFLYERYHVPVLVTENGMAAMDWISLDGHVHDYQRIDFLHQYILELHRAVKEGIPVLGYTVWSVMDNLEWAYGHDKRFGLIFVDYRTLERTMKDSAYWYRDVIRTNGEMLLPKNRE